MNPETKILTVFLFCLIVVLIVAFIVFKKKKRVEVKKNYPKVVDIVLDDFEDALS